MSITEPTTEQICLSFQDCLETGDKIDIYQTCAVAWRIANDRWVARFYYFKACICFIFQTTMLTLMVWQFSSENIRLTLLGEHPNQQDMSQIGRRYHLITKSIAFVASVWISVNVWSWLRNLEKQSLYRINIKDFRNCPVYVNQTWVAVGLLVNFFTLFMALIGNNIVLYFAENALEVILNCVAIFWLFGIDNELIGANDYQTMKHWITDFVRSSKKKSNSEIEKELEHRCMHNCGCWLCCCCCCSSCCSSTCCSEGCCGADDEEKRRESVELHTRTSTLRGGNAPNDDDGKKTHSTQTSITQSEVEDVSANTVSVQTNSYPSNEDTKEQNQTEQQAEEPEQEQEQEEEDDEDGGDEDVLVDVPLSVAVVSNAETEETSSSNEKGAAEIRACPNHSKCVATGTAKATCCSRALYVVVGILEILTLFGTVAAPIVILVLSFVA